MEVLRGSKPVRLTDLGAYRQRGSRAALVDGETTVSYHSLADRIEQRAAELGVERRVVTLYATNTIDTVVTYLACLFAGHVVSIRIGGAGVDDSNRAGDPFATESVELHPDLAALMSTSGSTGAAKAVKLSVGNIESNAIAIAESLHLQTDDVAITSLPLHYCYGLSIVTSHLVAGAAVVVTDTSVVDPCFWNLIERHGVTTLSGVPHTFELVARLGNDPLASGSQGASIRRITQAGGRMDPEIVRHHAEDALRHGRKLFVMYGQTEATARMTVLDPDLTTANPQSIGRPINGGSIRLEPVPLDDVPAEMRSEVQSGRAGEIVYRGPNVMLGYASTVDDLAVGRTVDELWTGDIARLGDDGLLEIVGRRSQFVKILGHRIDLGELEARLSHLGAVVTGDDEHIVVAVTGPHSAAVRDELSSIPVPPCALCVHELDAIPRLANGKLDRRALMGLPTPFAAHANRDAAGTGPRQSVATVYADVLGVDHVGPDDSFTSLGGDSLSYVEVSLRLEGVLGALPAGWHLEPVERLDAGVRERNAVAGDRVQPPTRQVDTSVVVRAIGICIIVATHMGVARLAGGAHTLLAVAGYNFARFQLTAMDVPGRLRRGLSTVARVAAPASLWIGVQMLLVGGYSAGSLFLVNNYFGSPWRRDGRWEYWYFEAFVQIFLALTLLFALRPVRRLERRWPFGFVAVALVPATAVGLEIVELADGYNSIFRPHTTVWFVLLGWAGYRARTGWHRCLVTAILAGGSLAFFDRWQQAAMVTVLVGTVLWTPTVRLPRLLAPVVGAVAAASMITFLIHWQVWPIYTTVFAREVAYVLTIASGVAVWVLGRWSALRSRLNRARQSLSSM